MKTKTKKIYTHQKKKVVLQLYWVHQSTVKKLYKTNNLCKKLVLKPKISQNVEKLLLREILCSNQNCPCCSCLFVLFVIFLSLSLFLSNVIFFYINVGLNPVASLGLFWTTRNSNQENSYFRWGRRLYTTTVNTTFGCHPKYNHNPHSTGKCDASSRLYSFQIAATSGSVK